MRTQEERMSAVTLLKENKEKTREFNYFGESNYDKIDVMIDVISNNMNYHKIEDKYLKNKIQFKIAEEAIDYLDGECEIEDLLFPENK